MKDRKGSGIIEECRFCGKESERYYKGHRGCKLCILAHNREFQEAKKHKKRQIVPLDIDMYWGASCDWLRKKL